MIKRLACTAASVVAFCAGTASATWSILIVDTRTGEIGVASATCLVALDLRELTPMLVSELGGLTAQSAGDSRGVNRTFVRDRMIEGVAPADIVTMLAAFDPGHQSRQYGLLDIHGRAATFSGSQAGPWAGGVTGQVGDLVYAVQGNVLTGEPVVGMAEQAIIATPGDLPEKLMAAMEAARSMGGDGRCSCNVTQPESCGAPPPEFEKSAHIAYMLVSRPGDYSAAYGVYDAAGGTPWTLAVLDFDSDGRPDVLTGGETSSTLTLLRNITAPGAPMTVMSEQSRFTGLASMRALVAGDWNSDTVPDIAIGSAGVGGVRVMLGDGAGNFALDQTVALGATIGSMAEAMGGIACLSPSTGNLFVLDPDAGWTTLASGNVGSAPVAVRTDPADANAAFVARAGEVRRVVRSGAAITVDRTIPIASGLVDVAAGDVNNDGRTDLVAMTGSSGTAYLLLDDGLGGYTTQSFAIGRVGRNAMMADFDGDGDIDPAVYTNGQANLHILRNDGNDTYVRETEKTIGRGPRTGLPHDMNGDGYPDIVSGGVGADGVVIGDNDHGRFTELAGTGAGDFFMQLNVADAAAPDPEPVFQLREQFDAWRADLLGRVDAVQSSTQLDAYAVPVNSQRMVELNIVLRDWQLDPVTSPINLEILPTDGTLDLATISQIEHLGGGRYRAIISHNGVPGVEELDIVADAGDRTVILTPRPVFRVTAATGDFDGDGVVSFFDLLAFLNAFSASDPAADLNSDGELDFFDVQMFLAILSG